MGKKTKEPEVDPHLTVAMCFTKDEYVAIREMARVKAGSAFDFDGPDEGS